MPVNVPKALPAKAFLEKENIFVMDSTRALMQEIRPLKIAVLNLMPNKIATETQLLRLLANTPLQIEAVLLSTASYVPHTAPIEHLNSFYITFEEAMKQKMRFDGLIITGAPVEKMDFTQVAYWDELSSIMEWAKHHVHSTMYICWAAQAAMYYNYGINKTMVDKKIFGIFNHRVVNKTNPLVRGFDDDFFAPHSRYTQVDAQKVYLERELDVLAESDEAGLYLVASKSGREVYVFGHGEYDVDTLHNEYVRDRDKGLKTAKPKNYYVNGEVGRLPKMSWRSHESLLISNWLNYCVYQSTPYDINQIK